MPWKLARVAIAAVALLLGARVYARSDIAQADRDFVVSAASRNLAEIKLGNLAIERGIDPQVKEFGRRMVDDRTKANNELKKVAAKKKIALPKQLRSDDQGDYDRLSRLSGSEFDHAYLDLMTSRLHDAVGEFETEAGTGSDKDVQRWAQKNVTVLRAHHDLAREDRTRL
jgi:putative membrane protein